MHDKLRRVGAIVAGTLVVALCAAAPMSAVRAAKVLDYGLGPGIVPTRTALPPTPSVPPQIGPLAASQGAFGPPVRWPLVAIHVVLLPDGRVLSFGSDATGNQGGQRIYDVWSPALGTAGNAHMTLPNTIMTDIFCAGQVVLPATGQALIVGGSVTIGGVRNYAQNLVETFNASANVLAPLGQMTYQRWYPSTVALPNGQVVVLGGRLSLGNYPAIVPEIWSQSTGWSTLPGAASKAAFGQFIFTYVPADDGGVPTKQTLSPWWYPRGFVTPAGNVLIVGYDGKFFALTPSGQGAIAQTDGLAWPSNHTLPTVMYAPNKLLSVRADTIVNLIDITGPKPSVTFAPNLEQNRSWANATVLADGRVFLSGGSLVANTLTGVAYLSKIWDPSSNAWTAAATALKPRLYHSTALLLPDGSVLTAGGGSNGPYDELNAEIYYPSYLYAKDGSGKPATRPTLLLPANSVSAGSSLTGTVGQGQTISRLSLIRTGATTHSTNLDQRQVDLTFTQTGQVLTALLPGRDSITPGYYMVFAFDASGVPSIASIVQVTWDTIPVVR